jgi:hypothetical protein
VSAPLIPQEMLMLPNGHLTTSWRQFFTRLANGVSTTSESVTGTPYSATGTITAGQASYSFITFPDGSFRMVGTLIVSNNGTGAGALYIPLPDSAGRIFSQSVGVGSAFSVGALTGRSMQVTMGDKIGPGILHYVAISISNPDGTYPSLAATDSVYFDITF